MNGKVFGALMTGALAFAAQAKTIAWYHLDELDVDVKATKGSAPFLNAIDPTKHAGQACATPKIDGKWQTASSYLPVGAEGFPDGGVYRDYVAGTATENPRSVVFRPKPEGSRNTGPVIVVPADPEFVVTNFTMEFFFKPDLTGTMDYQQIMCQISPVPATEEGQASGGLRIFWNHKEKNIGSVLYSRWRDPGQAAKTNDVTILGAADVNVVENGRWHHVALTYDAATRKGTVYLDYNHVASSTTTTNLVGLMLGELQIGNADVGWGAYEGFIDEVRFSDQVLGPAEFLRVTDDADAPQAFPETVVYQRFSTAPSFFGDSSVTNNRDRLVNEAPIAASFGSIAGFAKYGAGCFPIDEVPVANVSTGGLGCARAVNRNAIALRSTELSRSKDGNPDNPSLLRGCPCWYFSDPGSSLASCDFTAEMFVRCTNVLQNTYFFCQKGSWLLSVDGSSVKINSKGVCDTTKIADGYWHHVALVVDSVTKKGTFYLDYLKQSGEKGSEIDQATGNLEASIGVGCYGNNNFITFTDIDFDDVRITKRKLLPGQFLRPTKDNVIADFSFDRSDMGFGKAWSVTRTQTGWPAQSFAYETEDKPGSTVADSVFAAAVTNENARRVVGGVVGQAGLGYYELIGDDVAKISDTGFTFEYEARVPVDCYTNYVGSLNAGYMAYQSDATTSSNALWMIVFYPSTGDLNWRYYDKAGSKYVSFATVKKGAWADDKWHHYGVVYDKTTKEYRAYFDYQSVGSSAWEIPSASDKITFGSGNWGQSLGMHTWKFDNLRLTAKALKPSEFKTSKHIGDGDTVVWAPLDRKGDIVSAAEGVPTFSGTAWGAGAGQLVDATGAAIEARGRNKGALASGGAYSRLSTLEIPDFTAEFFVKNAAAATDGTDLVALMGPDGTTPIWSVRKTSGGLDVMATPQGGTLTDVGTFAVAPTGWAHVAISFEPGDGETTVKLYLNHVLADTKTFAGTLAVDGIATSALTFGSFAGAIDELRITKGVCDLTDMLYADPFGILILFR